MTLACDHLVGFILIPPHKDFSSATHHSRHVILSFIYNIRCRLKLYAPVYHGTRERGSLLSSALREKDSHTIIKLLTCVKGIKMQRLSRSDLFRRDKLLRYVREATLGHF